jgi:shikimate kinase
MNAYRNIALAGFMGTGKSTVGRRVAARLGWPFVDADAVIETRTGRSIPAIFADEGEAAFRRLEAQVCRELATQPGHVIATGGGALLDPDTRAAFEAHSLLVCLRCDLDTIIQRVGDDPDRPLFAADRPQLARLLAARAPVYDSLPHQFDTTHRTPQQVAEEIVTLWHT